MNLVALCPHTQLLNRCIVFVSEFHERGQRGSCKVPSALKTVVDYIILLRLESLYSRLVPKYSHRNHGSVQYTSCLSCGFLCRLAFHHGFP